MEALTEQKILKTSESITSGARPVAVSEDTRRSTISTPAATASEAVLKPECPAGAAAQMAEMERSIARHALFVPAGNTVQALNLARTAPRTRTTECLAGALAQMTYTEAQLKLVMFFQKSMPG